MQQTPRHQLGWQDKASAFLTESACKDGAESTGTVVQHHLTATSTMLRVRTSQGWYFLKSPCGGCIEVEITSTVASLFPELVLRVVSISKTLNCFVSPPFTDVSPEPHELDHVIRRVARLHHGSREHIKYLAKNGAPVRDVKGLIEKIEDWINGKGVMSKDSWTSLETRNHLRALLPFVRKLGEGLRGPKVPMALLHGNLEISNLTHEPGGVVGIRCAFFSTGSTHISDILSVSFIGYPFCKFHRMRLRLPEKCIDEYLRTWSCVMSMDRARALFERCWILGKFFELISLGEWYEAEHAGAASDVYKVFVRHVESFYNAYIVEKNPFNSFERHSL